VHIRAFELRDHPTAASGLFFVTWRASVFVFVAIGFLGSDARWLLALKTTTTKPIPGWLLELTERRNFVVAQEI
jgi:hypothetical protein